MIELVYAACAFVLLPTTVDVVDYHFYENGVYQFSQTPNVVSVCGPGYYPNQVEYRYSVTYWPPGFESSFESEISDPLVVKWVPDADFDDDGVVGMGDFGLFSNAFGSTDPRFDLDNSGAVGFGDFGLFTQRFGECLSENHVKVVPCG